MDNKGCNKCKKQFKYLYLLKKHQRRKFECCKAIDDGVSNICIRDSIRSQSVNLEEIFLDEKLLVMDNQIPTSDTCQKDESVLALALDTNVQSHQPLQPQEIINIDTYISNTVENKTIKCDKCESIFKYKTNLYRHKRENRCNPIHVLKVETDKKLKSLAQIQSLLEKLTYETDITFKRQAMNFIEKNFQFNNNPNQNNLNPSVGIAGIAGIAAIPNAVPDDNAKSNVANTDNKIIQVATTGNIHSNNITNTNNNNNNITNNYINVKHINPFRLEDVTLLKKEIMLEVLKTLDVKDGVKAIIHMIYERRENKNFFKMNRSLNGITYLTENFDLNVSEDSEFKKQILVNALNIYERILYLCKNDLSCDEISCIIDNLQDVVKHISPDNGHTFHLNNESGDLFMREIFSIVSKETTHNNTQNREACQLLHRLYKSEPKFKELTDKVIRKTKQLIKHVALDKIPNISAAYFDELLGVADDNISLQPDTLDIELKTMKFENTSLSKYYTWREQEEKELLCENKTIGNIDKYNQIRKIRSQDIDKQRIDSDKIELDD